MPWSGGWIESEVLAAGVRVEIEVSDRVDPLVEIDAALETIDRPIPKSLAT